MAVEKFKACVWDYYHTHGRFFPWRHSEDPYLVLVSEMMLQQTQTYRVEPYFNKFISRFPDFVALKNASWAEVLASWQGLGYNRRAKYLHQIANIIVTDYHGVVPTDIELLDNLPGIGYATACAIYTFSFNLPVAFIETNIRSVFLYHFFKLDQKSITDAEIMVFVKAAVDKERPRDWYYALMDYGVFLKKTYGNPNTSSAHYNKQSRFEGSKRQVRGNILKLLVHTNGVCVKVLYNTIPEGQRKYFEEVLTELLTEGLIKRDSEMIFL